MKNDAKYSLREKKSVKYFDDDNENENSSFSSKNRESISFDNESYLKEKYFKLKIGKSKKYNIINNKKKVRKLENSSSVSISELNDENIEIPTYLKYCFDKNKDNCILFKKDFSLNIDSINKISEINNAIQKLEEKYILDEIKKQKIDEIVCPINSIPINADITKFNFEALSIKQKQLTGKLFDVILLDPPWQIGSKNPSRGVSISYKTLSDKILTNIPIYHLQDDGFLFIWTINSKYKTCLDLMEYWGYKYVDEIDWIKFTHKGKLAKGNGFYLQHCKETCVIGKKGDPKFFNNIENDVILSERRGQSQKPQEIYDYIEKFIPNGHYLEIFGRRNNLRNNWVTIGNEI